MRTSLSKALLRHALYKCAGSLDGEALNKKDEYNNPDKDKHSIGADAAAVISSALPVIENGIQVGKTARTPITMAETLVGATPGVVTTTGNVLGIPYMAMRGVHDVGDTLDTSRPPLERMRSGVHTVNDAVGTFGPIFSANALPAALTFDATFDGVNALHDTYVPDAKAKYDQDRMDAHTNSEGVVDPDFLSSQSGLTGTLMDMYDRADLITDGLSQDLYYHTPELFNGAVNGWQHANDRVSTAKDKDVIDVDGDINYHPGVNFRTRMDDSNGRVYWSDMGEALFGRYGSWDRAPYLSRLLIEQPLHDAGELIRGIGKGMSDERNRVGISPEELARRKTQRDKLSGDY